MLFSCSREQQIHAHVPAMRSCLSSRSANVSAVDLFVKIHVDFINACRRSTPRETPHRVFLCVPTMERVREAGAAILLPGQGLERGQAGFLFEELPLHILSGALFVAYAREFRSRTARRRPRSRLNLGKDKAFFQELTDEAKKKHFLREVCELAAAGDRRRLLRRLARCRR